MSILRSHPGLFAAVLSPLLLSTAARAQLQAAHYGVSASAGIAHDAPTAGGSGSSPRNIAVDNPVHVEFRLYEGAPLSYGWDLEQVASAETHGGTRPEAIASAEAHVRNFVDNTGYTNASAYASASAHISYTVRIRPRNDTGLGWQPSSVPVEVRASGHVNGRGSADVSIQNPYRETLFNASATTFGAGDSSASFDRTSVLAVTLDRGTRDAYLNVTISAHAFANDLGRLSEGNSVTNVSDAYADPTFAFDQAAFDLYASGEGQETFDLSDYFEFEYSPGLIPEPSSWCALAGARRKGPRLRRAN